MTKLAILMLITLLNTAVAGAEETVIRDYLVKGMTCGGCVFGVKKALERAGIQKERILDVDYRKPDPEHSVGHAKVSFKKDEYRGVDTDCRIVQAIKSALGYVAYWDASNTNPCHL